MSESNATGSSQAPAERAAPPEPETKRVMRFLPVAAVIGVIVLVAAVALLLLSTREPPMKLRTTVLGGGGPTRGHTITTKFFSKPTSTKPTPKIKGPASVLANVSRRYLRRTLRFLSGKPHLSGTKYSEENVTDFIVGEFRKHGLDTAEKVPYRVLHQYPDPKNPNKVQLVDAEGEVLDEAKLQEDPVPGDHTDTVVPGYLAYARPGTVEVGAG